MSLVRLNTLARVICVEGMCLHKVLGTTPRSEPGGVDTNTFMA